MDIILKKMSRIQEMMKNMDICAKHAKKIASQVKSRGIEGISYVEDSHCFKIHIGKRKFGEIEFDTLSVAVAPDRYGNRISDHNGSTNYTPECIEGLLFNGDKIINEMDYEMDHFSNIDEIINKINSLRELPCII